MKNFLTLFLILMFCVPCFAKEVQTIVDGQSYAIVDTITKSYSLDEIKEHLEYLTAQLERAQRDKVETAARYDLKIAKLQSLIAEITTTIKKYND